MIIIQVIKLMEQLIISSGFMSVIITIVLAIYLHKLIKTFHFYRALKSKMTVSLTGEIIEAYGIVNRSYDSTKAAKAKYTVLNKEVTGRMICSCDHKLTVGEQVKIIIPKHDIKIFSFSEKQVRDALMTNVIFTAISLIALTAAAGIFINLLVHIVIDCA